MSTTLLVCEKPDAANRIAEALSDEKPRRLLKHGMPYYDISHDKERLIICPALGHLYTVASEAQSKRDSYPVWDFTWKPRHKVEHGQKRLELWIQAINELSKQADKFANGCDYDLEGSLIGYMILKYACEGAESKAKRMKFSTLTRNDLRSAYSNLASNLDFKLAYAGMCRHEVDWLYGINLSRALTTSANKYGGGYVTLSTGRVQGPTLRFLVEREKEIQKFVPQPYWTIDAKVRIDDEIVSAEYQSQKLQSMELAKHVVDDCLGKTGVVTDLRTTEIHLAPPHPFDLSTLQSEAYRLFGISPRESLGIAERLYLDALISYPRTSSQKLPPSIGYLEILNSLAKSTPYTEKCRKLLSSSTLRPFEGEKTDPAHPAVYPTGALPSTTLDKRVQRVFDLIVKRFMATFAQAATRSSERVTISVQNHVFYIHGSRISKSGWIDFYTPYAKFEEIELPPIELGKEVVFHEVVANERFTQPPARYNPSSLLRLMEEQEIGTKATRAEIVDTLYKRGYVREERMIASTLAFDVIELMLKYCPRIVDIGFTKELEEKMQKIEVGEINKEDVVRGAAEALRPAIEELKTNELAIAKILGRSARLAILSEKTLTTPCPTCGSKLYVQKSRTTGKRFISCSGTKMPECKFMLPLPQLGKLTLLNKNCPKCGFQMVRTWSRGRRPMISCSRCYAMNIQKSS
jgi:DNA topoisomerase-1